MQDDPRQYEEPVAAVGTSRATDNAIRRLLVQASSRPARLLAPALLAFLAAGAVAVALLVTRGGDEVELDARKLMLELAYPPAGAVTAVIDGQPEAAPAGARVSCRTTDDRRALGQGRAAADGSLRIELDAAPWPLESLTGDAWQTLNQTLECRAESGPWVQPLRPPYVAVN
jgi:hypothetical protein